MNSLVRCPQSLQYRSTLIQLQCRLPKSSHAHSGALQSTDHQPLQKTLLADDGVRGVMYSLQSCPHDVFGLLWPCPLPPPVRVLVELFVFVGEAAVDLLKSLVENCQRIQGFFRCLESRTRTVSFASVKLSRRTLILFSMDQSAAALIFFFLPTSRLPPPSVLALAPPTTCSCPRSYFPLPAWYPAVPYEPLYFPDCHAGIP